MISFFHCYKVPFLCTLPLEVIFLLFLNHHSGKSSNIPLLLDQLSHHLLLPLKLKVNTLKLPDTKSEQSLSLKYSFTLSYKTKFNVWCSSDRSLGKDKFGNLVIFRNHYCLDSIHQIAKHWMCKENCFYNIFHQLCTGLWICLSNMTSL